MGISSIQKQRLARALRHFPVARVQLFGSRARGEARRDSDYDLLIFFQDDYTPGLFELGGLHHTLTEALGAPVDVVPYRSSLPPAILKDAKTIFERR
jgi:predicted nucleotidyltransferase